MEANQHESAMFNIFLVICAAFIVSAVLLGVACGGVQGAMGPDLVRQYAECLADPAMPLHVAAGAERSANVHDAGLRAELKAGETTLAEIKAAFEMFCDAD